MLKNRTVYISFDTILIFILWLCSAILLYSLFIEDNVFSASTLLSIITGLVFLGVCIKKNIGGFLFKLFVLLLVLYFIQRIVLLSIDQDFFTFHASIRIDASNISSALLYLFFSIVAILLGYSFGSNLVGRSRLRGISDVSYGWFNKEIYRKQWIVISFLFLFTKLFVLVYLKQGFGVISPSSFNWIFRPLNILGMIFIMNILLLVQNKIELSDSEKMALKLFIVIYIFILVISGSRAALLSVVLGIILAKFVTGELRVDIKRLALLLFIISISFIYFAVINVYRGHLQERFILHSAGTGNVADYFSAIGQFKVMDSINFLSGRLNGFDLLIAAMEKKVELSSYLNIQDALLRTVDSLYPGSLFPQEYEPGEVIPMVLRNVNISDYLFYREHMHLIGMSGIYFGYIGGIIFLFIVALMTVFVIHSRINIFIKLLFINVFLIYPFENGFIEGFFQIFSENIFMYGVIVVLIKLSSAAHSVNKFTSNQIKRKVIHCKKTGSEVE